MVYTREKIEQIVLGTLLNDIGDEGFFKGSRNVLRDDLFSDKRNVFVFSVIKRMRGEGMESTSPCDVFRYTA